MWHRKNKSGLERGESCCSEECGKFDKSCLFHKGSVAGEEGGEGAGPDLLVPAKSLGNLGPWALHQGSLPREGSGTGPAPQAPTWPGGRGSPTGQSSSQPAGRAQDCRSPARPSPSRTSLDRRRRLLSQPRGRGPRPVPETPKVTAFSTEVQHLSWRMSMSS